LKRGASHIDSLSAHCFNGGSKKGATKADGLHLLVVTWSGSIILCSGDSVASMLLYLHGVILTPKEGGLPMSIFLAIPLLAATGLYNPHVTITVLPRRAPLMRCIAPLLQRLFRRLIIGTPRSSTI